MRAFRKCRYEGRVPCSMMRSLNSVRSPPLTCGGKEEEGSGVRPGVARLPLCEEPAVHLLLEQLPIVREDLSECFLGADVEREVLDERGEPLREV